VAGLAGARAGAPSLPELDWAVANRAHPGEHESGDLHMVASIPDGALLAVVDGLGHGEEAAAAARAATAVVEGNADEAPETIVRRCHEALGQTRGVVMTVASLDAHEGTMRWLGVGNVEGVLLRGRARADHAYERAPLRAGIVGFRLPVLHASMLSVRPGDVLVLASDGIKHGFDRPVGVRESAQGIADRILAELGNPADDALVLVARYLGNAK
jgi:negative regulator of sigma-B (phosphoserine phosphatase)